MIKYQKNIYQFTLYFSIIINLFLLVFLIFVIRDSVSQKGEFSLEGRSFWYFVAVIAAYTLVNCYMFFNFLKEKKNAPQTTTQE